MAVRARRRRDRGGRGGWWLAALCALWVLGVTEGGFAGTLLVAEPRGPYSVQGTLRRLGRAPLSLNVTVVPLNCTSADVDELVAVRADGLARVVSPAGTPCNESVDVSFDRAVGVFVAGRWSEGELVLLRELRAYLDPARHQMMAMLPQPAGPDDHLCGALRGPFSGSVELVLLDRAEPGARNVVQDQVPAAVRELLCTASKAYDVSDENLAMIDETAGAEQAGAVVGPVAGAIMGPVMDQVSVQMEPTVSDRVSKNVGRATTAETPEIVSAHVSLAVARNVSNLVTDLLVTQVSAGITERLTDMYAQYVHDHVASLVQKQTIRQAGSYLASEVPRRVTDSVPYAAARAVLPALTMRLTHAVTHALVPAVVMGLKWSFPSAWEFPECQDTLCEFYNHEISKYYVSKHSAHFGAYWAGYYGEYYRDAAEKMDKIFNS